MNDDEIDNLYDCMDYLMKKNCWVIINHMMSDASKMYERIRRHTLLVDDYDKDFILALLTITLPVKSVINYRDDLYYEATFIFDKETLKGLK